MRCEGNRVQVSVRLSDLTDPHVKTTPWLHTVDVLVGKRLVRWTLLASLRFENNILSDREDSFQRGCALNCSATCFFFFCFFVVCKPTGGNQSPPTVLECVLRIEPRVKT